MKIKGIDYVFYNVTDFERSKKFYRDTLGLKLTSEVAGGWAEFDTGNLALAIGVYGATGKDAGKKSNVCAVLAVDDVKEAAEYLRAKGVKVTMEPAEHEPCFMAMIEDPDGNEIMLHKRKDGTVG